MIKLHEEISSTLDPYLIEPLCNMIYEYLLCHCFSVKIDGSRLFDARYSDQVTRFYDGFNLNLFDNLFQKQRLITNLLDLEDMDLTEWCIHEMDDKKSNQCTIGCLTLLDQTF